MREGIIDRGLKPVNLGRAVVEPTCRPNAVDAPPFAFKDFLTQTVPISNRTGLVVACAVALDAKQKVSGALGVTESDVYEEPRHPNLWLALHAH